MGIFNQVQFNRVKKNTFDLTHDRKLSCKMGELIPVMMMEVVPGDVVSVKPNVFVRFAPLIAPVMHRASVYCHTFFVPNRILWDNWPDFITGGEDGEDNSVWPYLTLDYAVDGDPDAVVGVGSLADHLGLPARPDVTNGVVDVSALPFAAYQRIYNEYYRDQNLVTEVPGSELIDGSNNVNLATLTAKQNRAWQHDYFTSALPFTQKGPEALLPMTGRAPVSLDPDAGPPFNQWDVFNALTGSVPADGPLESAGGSLFNSGAGVGVVLDPDGTISADLAAAAGVASINDLRRAIMLQVWLERNARGGSRYTESLMVHFGVKAQDSRLQRPEYIGGFSTPIAISEVLQTSAVPDQPTPQGNMAGHGVSVGSGGYSKFYAPEHGIIMTIMSIMPMSAYQQGVPRAFSRSDKFDYYWPEFSRIGEQPILNKELYLNAANQDEVFGYTPRYAEYKFMPNSVHGQFKTTLDFWHMGRKFISLPNLNDTFITMDESEVARIFAVTDGDHMWCHVLNEVKAKRPMPYFGTPTI